MAMIIILQLMDQGSMIMVMAGYVNPWSDKVKNQDSTIYASYAINA